MNFSIKNPIPPRSIIRIAKGDKSCPRWKLNIGKFYRVGYYSKQDGLDVIWMVNDDASYEQATDHDYLNKYFEVVEVSDETDLHGVDRDTLKPMKLN